MFIWRFNKSVLVTYIAIASAVTGIYLATGGYIKFSFIALILCGVADMFDGKFARMCVRTEEDKMFGVELDSLADMMSFVALPLAIFYSMGLNSFMHIFIYVLYTIAAVTRLSKFNVSAIANNTDEPVKFYSGLPVTSTAGIFPLFWLLSLVLNAKVFNMVYTIIIALVGFLFVLNIKIKKPQGKFYIAFSVVAIIGITIFTLFI